MSLLSGARCAKLNEDRPILQRLKNSIATFVDFSDAKIAHKFEEVTLNGVVEYRSDITNSRFLRNMLLYFGNGSR